MIALLVFLVGCSATAPPPLPPPLPKPVGVIRCEDGEGMLYIPFFAYGLEDEELVVVGSDGQTYRFEIDRCYFMDPAT